MSREAQLVAERDAALRQCVRLVREVGEAKGKLEMSEAVGIVDMWREENARLKVLVKQMQSQVQRTKLARNAKPTRSIPVTGYTFVTLGLLKPLLKVEVSRLHLSVRTLNVMANLNVKTVGDLVKISRKELRRTQNCGGVTIKEVELELALFGLELANE